MRQEIATAAEQMVGTPFRAMGREPGRALDCVGVVLCAHWMAGYPMEDFGRRYNLDSIDPEVVERELARRLRRVDSSRPEAGDVFLMGAKTPCGGQHLGIWTGDVLVHADQVKGCVIAHRADRRVLKRVRSIWRTT